TEPYPQFLYAITLSYGAIVPREAAQYYGDKFSENPVGTGPYKLREWRHDKHLIWDKNPTYREEYYPIVPEKLHLPAGMPTRESFLPYQGKRLPLSDRVVVQVLKEAQVSWFQFQSGHIDTSLLDKDTFTTAVQNQTKLTSGMAGKGIRLTYYPSPTISYLSFNMDDPVVGTPAGVKGAAIRKALSLSFDQADYIKRYLQGQGEPATMLIPPGVFGYNDSYQYRWARYAPEEGIRLLKDAGFIVEQKGGTVVTKDPKTGEQLQLLVVQAGQSTASADYARYLNFSGARIGIRVDSEQVTYSEYLKRQQNGIGQAYDSGWIMDYPDPQNMMQLLYGPNAKTINSSSYNSSRYNQLYEAMSSIDHTSPATSAADIQRKKDLVVEMHRVLDDDCPWLIQYFDKTYVLTHAWQNTTLPNHFAYNIYKYRYSDPRLRIDLAGDWNKADALPGILFACLVVTVIVMFVARIVRQE
ncbi:MAG: ABC transporter substrate-binding protein, partial [Planctomycetes bacterium]|nr:ABC transporter substrate-binding protein [Planctomycetota bacterium]